MIRSDPIDNISEFPIIGDEWFNDDNNLNAEGDQNMLDNFVKQDDFLRVVQPEVDEGDKFLGRSERRKSRMRIMANDQGEELIISADIHDEKCSEKHKKIKGNIFHHVY